MKYQRIKYLFVILTLFMLTTSCKKTKIYPNLIPFATGIEQPVSIANAGDSRLFVVGQLGSVYIVDSSGNVMDSPFLDIHERVVYGGERGLLGLAFHPNYRQNGYFFVNYIGENDSTHISRFSVSRDNPNHADPSSEVKLLTLKQPFENHNGGNLIFGPDGDLYIGLGDGGSAGDPGNRAQNLMEYFGKMLRINVDSGNSYRIPASNPFVHSLNARGEIWALGLRNPWRFSFDRLTGDLWIADVGQNEIEEIDCQPASSKGGENYGWRIYEGNKSYKPEKAKEGSNFVFPVYTYPHGPECSITGGFVYRGSDKSPYYGHYFFADYCSDKIWTLYKQNGVWASEEFGHYDGNHFSTFGEDSKGRLYVAGLTTGTIYRINDLPTGPGK